MARTIELLTAKEVEHLKEPGMHLVDVGLYPQIKKGARSWIHRYTFKGKARWSGLGSYPQMSLAGARDRRDLGALGFVMPGSSATRRRWRSYAHAAAG